MRGLVHALCLAALVIGGCSSKGEKQRQTIRRDRDAAAVVVVQQTQTGVTFADEVEPNNEPDQAGPLPLPGGIHGVLDDQDDVDRYQLKVEQAGWLNVSLSGIDGVDLVLELDDAAGKLLAKSDRGPARTPEGLPNYPVQPGTYSLAVSEFHKKRRKRKARTGPSPTYDLVARLDTDEPAANQEREPNEEPTQAMELLLGVDGFGYVGWNGDVDLWRYSFDNFGEDYSFDVDVTGVEGVRLSVDVLDDNSDPVVSRNGDKGKAVAIRNLQRKSGNDHYYVRVGGRSSNPLERYSIRLTSRLMDLDEEREPNDDQKSAQALRDDPKEVEGTRKGYLGPGDHDWYRLPAGTSAALVTVSVEAPVGVDVTLAAHGADGALIGESNGGAAGEREELDNVSVAAGKDLYFEITGTGSADGGEPYTLRWRVAPTAAAPAPDPNQP